MFDKEQSDAFVLGLEGMKNAVPLSLSYPLLEWYKQLHHLSVPSGGGPHERGDPIFVSWILVENDDFDNFCVSTLESMVQSVVTLIVAHLLLMFKKDLYNLLATSLCSNHKRSPATGVSPPHSSRRLLASATSHGQPRA